jgi:uncharacterized protein
MIIHELTVAECEGLLARSTVGRLACADDGQPYIVPISYAFDQAAGCLYGFSTLGRKIEWMRRNPKVCVAVDETADRFRWTSVVVTGRYEELGDDRDARESRQRLHQHFEQRQSWWLPATARLAAGEERETPVFYRIRIDQLSGRQTSRPA